MLSKRGSLCWSLVLICDTSGPDIGIVHRLCPLQNISLIVGIYSPQKGPALSDPCLYTEREKEYVRSVISVYLRWVLESNISVLIPFQTNNLARSTPYSQLATHKTTTSCVQFRCESVSMSTPRQRIFKRPDLLPKPNAGQKT